MDMISIPLRNPWLSTCKFLASEMHLVACLPNYEYVRSKLTVSSLHQSEKRYAIKENKEKRKKVKLFWENGNLYPGSNIEGMKRLNGIIGMGDPEDEYFRVEEEDYRLGQIRTKEQFFRLYGIHANTKTVEDNLCKFVGKPMHFMFKKHLRENRMGIDFSKIDFEYKDPDKGKKQQRKRMRPPLQPR